MYEKTVDGTYVSSISKHWPYIVGIRSAQQRQAFSFNIKLDMHSYPIQKQTSVDFTFHWRNEMLELSQLTGMIHIETFRSTIVKLYDIWHIFWEHLMIMLTDLFLFRTMSTNMHWSNWKQPHACLLTPFWTKTTGVTIFLPLNYIWKMTVIFPVDAMRYDKPFYFAF